MNRVRRFYSGLVAGYAELGANLLFTLTSIPIALAFLPKEEFGLWALVMQISGYLMLLDFGLTSSVPRFLTEYKDQTQGNQYGNVLRTANRIIILLGGLLAAAACLLAVLLPSFLSLPISLHKPFMILMIGQGICIALSFPLRVWSSPLLAHQRLDLYHWSGVANFIVSFFVLFFFLQSGVGVYSLLAGSLAGSLISWFFPLLGCHFLRLFPTKDKKGAYSPELFVRLLRFGRDVFLIHFGNILCSGSQIILISKFLGLDYAATYAVALKLFNLFSLLIGRIFNNAAPALTEMYVRKDLIRFGSRFSQVVSLSVALAIPIAFFLMSSNRAVVSIWTSGKIQWSFDGDIILGVLLIANILSRSFVGTFGILGSFSPVRFLSLFEGLLFLILGSFGALFFGLTGVVGASLFAHIFVTLVPSFLILKKYINPCRAANFYFLSLLLGLIILNAVILGFFISDNLVMLLVSCAGFVIWVLLSWCFCLTPALRAELKNHFFISLYTHKIL